MKLINEFLEYLKVIKHYSEKTIISYEFDICELYNYFKSKKIDIINITRKDTEAYLEFLYSLKIDKNTISRKLSSIRSFYNYLVINYLPASQYVLPAAYSHADRPLGC